MILTIPPGGSWLRIVSVRCERGHIFGSISSVLARCPRCGAPGPWVKRTPEELEFLKQMVRLEGRALTPQEENLAIAQAQMIGDLPV